MNVGPKTQAWALHNPLWWTFHVLRSIKSEKQQAGGSIMSRQTLRQDGLATLQKLFGSTDALGSTRQIKGLANLLVEPVFGGVWNRPGLAFEDRLLCTIAALATGPRMR